MVIDKTTYDKHKLYNPGIGYGFERDLSAVKTILIHTTNNTKSITTFESEANFLYTDKKVSAHFLNGKKRNQIVQLLDPKWVAWQAGAVIDAKYNNDHSIGIENHYSVGVGDNWTQDQHDNLTDLVQYLLAMIPSITTIETHRHARGNLLPKKIDPSGWSDIDFYIWAKDMLDRRNCTSLTKYEVNTDKLNIRSAPRADRDNIVGYFIKGDTFISDVKIVGEDGKYYNNSNEWAHIKCGNTQNKVVDNLGFVSLGYTKEILK